MRKRVFESNICLLRDKDWTTRREAIYYGLTTADQTHTLHFHFDFDFLKLLLFVLSTDHKKRSHLWISISIEIQMVH